MGAGEHDVVGAPAVLLDETGRDLPGDLGVFDRLAAQEPLGERGEDGRADQGDLAVGGVLADERMGIVARHRPARRQHADQPRARGAGGRLDRRHDADERQIRMGASQMRQREGRGGAAGDDDDVGAAVRDNSRHHRLDARDQRRPRSAGRKETPRRRRHRRCPRPAGAPGSRREPSGLRVPNRTQPLAAPRRSFPAMPSLRSPLKSDLGRLRQKSPARQSLDPARRAPAALRARENPLTGPGRMDQGGAQRFPTRPCLRSCRCPTRPSRPTRSITWPRRRRRPQPSVGALTLALIAAAALHLLIPLAIVVIVGLRSAPGPARRGDPGRGRGREAAPAAAAETGRGKAQAAAEPDDERPAYDAPSAATRGKGQPGVPGHEDDGARAEAGAGRNAWRAPGVEGAAGGPAAEGAGGARSPQQTPPAENADTRAAPTPAQEDAEASPPAPQRRRPRSPRRRPRRPPRRRPARRRRRPRSCRTTNSPMPRPNRRSSAATRTCAISRSSTA